MKTTAEIKLKRWDDCYIKESEHTNMLCITHFPFGPFNYLTLVISREPFNDSVPIEFLGIEQSFCPYIRMKELRYMLYFNLLVETEEQIGPIKPNQILYIGVKDYESI